MRSGSPSCFSIPLIWGMIVTGIVTYGILIFERLGFRTIELIIGALVSIIGLCYLIELFIVPVDWGSAAFHTVVPQIDDAAASTIAVGIIGATVMPHAVYLHSGLTQARMQVHKDADRRKLVRYFKPGSHRRTRCRGSGKYGDGDHGVRCFSRWSQ